MEIVTTTTTRVTSSLYATSTPTAEGEKIDALRELPSPTMMGLRGDASLEPGNTGFNGKKSGGRMLLSKRLERLGWQRINETSVDKRQEVSLAPVFSLQQLRVARQQQTSPGADELSETKSRLAIDPTVVRFTYESSRQTTQRHFFRSAAAASPVGGLSAGTGIAAESSLSPRRPSVCRASSRLSGAGAHQARESRNVDDMVKEMDALYVALSKARTRKQNALNRCGVFDDAVNELRARTQLRISLKKNVSVRTPTFSRPRHTSKVR